MASKKPGRPPNDGETVLLHLTVPIEINDLLESAARAGFLGRNKTDVAVTLLMRAFEQYLTSGAPEAVSKARWEFPGSKIPPPHSPSN
jgi:hypothetical protein